MKLEIENTSYDFRIINELNYASAVRNQLKRLRDYDLGKGFDSGD